ncbi:MAG: DUF4340 domain-containing protein [Gammaproteobacteria bacterium]|nr:DUF4340 domain-containing protein [Gammaproteobacteria bacterium]
MKRWIPILGVLLVVQLALAIVVYQTRPNYGAFEPRAKLLAFTASDIDGLQIDDGKGSVQLRRKEGRWVLAEPADAPADSGRITRLLEQLAKLDKGWPVATTAAAAPRFKVTDDAFERRLTLLTGTQQVARLYLGTSPGIRKVHARPAGDDAVYAVALETFEFGTGADDWIDRRIVALVADDLVRIALPGFMLERADQDWRLSGLAAGERTDSEEAHVLASKIADLEVQSLLGSEEQPSYRQATPALELTVAKRDGTELTYRFSQPEHENFWVLRRSDLPYFFKVADYAVKPLKEATREQLISQHDGAGGTAEAAAPSPSAPPATTPEENVDG